MEAKSKKAVFPGKSYLALLNLGNTEVIEAKLARQTRLIMSDELGSSPRDMRPFGETPSPPLVVLGNGMKLG
jgi:hypothetical protein